MTDDSVNNQSPSFEHDSSGAHGIVNMISSWLAAQKAIAGAGSKLLLADSKLAAVTILQIIILAVLAGILVVAVWIILSVLATIGLMHLGVSLTISLTLVLAFHIMLLCLIVWAISSSMAGLRFETSRALLRKVKTEISPSEN